MMEARISMARTLLMLLSLCQLLLLSVHVPGCTACSEPEGWQSLPIEARVRDQGVQFAVLGNVTGTTAPVFVRRFGGHVYGAQVAVECVYKRPPEQSVYDSLSVIGFGESNDCTATEVEPGRRYVLLMAPYQAGFAVVEANVQAAAEPATPEAEQALLDAFGCEPPSEPTTPPPTPTGGCPVIAYFKILVVAIIGERESEKYGPH